MTSDDERKGPELGPRRSRRAEPDYNIFLQSGAAAGESDETYPYPPGPQRGKVDVDVTIKLLRNLAALVVFSSVTLTLVAFAGIGMGVPPWFCLVVAFGGGPLTILLGRSSWPSVRCSPRCSSTDEEVHRPVAGRSR